MSRAERTPAGDDAIVGEVFDARPLLVVATEGPDHRLVAASGAYRMFADRGEVTGRPAREVFPDIAGQRLFELLDEVYSTGTPFTAKGWRLQLDTHGSPTDGDLYLDFSLTPWRRTDGSIRGILITQADVTEHVRERLDAQHRADEAHLRYLASRDVIRTLQTALLPDRLPVLPRLELAGRYLLAAEEEAAGGDWFDAIRLDTGHVVLVVCDVVGHGAAAAAAMGMLRGASISHLSNGSTITEALAEVDRFTATVQGGTGATICIVDIDPSSGDLTYCTAGHPPPMLLTPATAEARFLPPTGSGPLDSGLGPTVATAHLGDDDMIVLYSDGIIERPGIPAPRGTVELLQAVATITANRSFNAPHLSTTDRVRAVDRTAHPRQRRP